MTSLCLEHVRHSAFLFCEGCWHQVPNWAHPALLTSDFHPILDMSPHIPACLHLCHQPGFLQAHTPGPHNHTPRAHWPSFHCSRGPNGQGQITQVAPRPLGLTGLALTVHPGWMAQDSWHRPPLTSSSCPEYFHSKSDPCYCSWKSIRTWSKHLSSWHQSSRSRRSSWVLLWPGQPWQFQPPRTWTKEKISLFLSL